METIDDLLDGPPRRRRRRATANQPRLSEEEQSSILGDAGRAALGGLARLGNLLDVPGSMVRDVLVGENPLDQLLSPTTDENRNTGRDVLTKWGLTKPNDPDKWELADVAGFAADVALDPTTYLSGGMTALGKGGQVLKKAGLAKNIDWLAKEAGIGARQARRTKTLREALDVGTADEVARNYSKATTAAGGANELNAVLDEVLGGTHRFGVGRFSTTLDAGETYAKAMDSIGSAVRNSAPVRYAASMFDAKNKGQTSQFGQELAQKATERETRNMGDARGVVAAAAQELDRLGLGDDQYRRLARAAAEGIPGADATLVDFFDRQRSVLDSYRGRLGEVGVDIGDLNDLYAEYFPRTMTSGAARNADGLAQAGLDFAAQTAASKGRKDPLKNIVGGTNTIEDIIRDPDVDAAIKSMDSAKVRQVVDQKYRSQFGGDPELRRALEGYVDKTISGTPQEAQDAFDSFESMLEARYPGASQSYLGQKTGPILDLLSEKHAQEFADTIAGQSPDALKTGLFGNHPLQDMLGRLLGMGRAQAHADTTIDAVKDLIARGKLPSVQSYADGTDSLGNVMARMGLSAGDDKGGWIKELMARSNKPYDPKLAADIAKLRVPREIADDMLKMADELKSPQAIGKMLQAYDSIKNLSKAHWTGMFPSFHVRNLFSGSVQNIMRGIFSPGSLIDAHKLVRGKELKGYSSIPIIKQMIQSQGITETEAIRQLAMQYELVPKYGDMAGAAVTGVNDQTLGSGIEDLLSQMPGRTPFSFKETAKKAVGRGKDSTLNPLDVRGVGGRAESKFGPAQAAEDVGWYVESLNRITPFLEQLKKGVDPAEAKRIIDEAQVSYGARNYTKFENEVMSRLMPFYKFSKGAAVGLANELATNPGGMTGMAIKATNRARNPDDMTPDYVAETAAIPLGTAQNGDPRYLTGLGMMFEDPAQFFTGPQDFIGELISRASPAVKLPIELASGETFFQRGPDGGRPLDDLDPVLGRTISNIKQAVTGEEQRKPAATPQSLEMLFSNSPLARYGTTIRTLTDPRKSALDKLLVNTTGLRITDVSQAASDAKTNELMQQVLKGAGAKTFERVYMPKEEIANLPPDEQRRIIQAQQVLDILALRAKERKAQRQEESRRKSTGNSR